MLSQGHPACYKQWMDIQ